MNANLQHQKSNDLAKTSSSFFSPAFIQPKLTIGQPNDKYEQEADAMADKVMRMPQNMPAIQTKCAVCEQEESVQPKRKGNFLSLKRMIQKMSSSEEELQTKPMLQRMGGLEEEKLQTKPLMMKSEGGGEVATSALTSQLNSSKGGGSPLPASTNQFMSNAFGSDFSGVRVHTGSNAIQMNQGLGARAFAHGSDLYFNKGEYSPESSDGKRLLGHELTHVVQQGGGQKRAIQRYTVYDTASQSATVWNAGEDVRIAENGMTLTSENLSSKKCYAHPSLIAQSNRELDARNSGVRLVEQANTISGPVPNAPGRRTLKQILPTIAHSSSGASGTGQSSWVDCGLMARDVMGGSGLNEAPVGLCTNNSNDLEETTRTISPRAQMGNILVNLGLGPDIPSATAAYNAMSPVVKASFDQQHGLNRFAAPSIGEAFTIHNARGFNFHWGGVVLNPGEDRVTLENFYKLGPAQDNRWYFQTYGPASNFGQTWHDRWDDSPARNSFTTRTSTRSLTGVTNVAGVRLADQRSQWNDPAHYVNLANNTQIQRLRTYDHRWIKVKVLSGPYIDRIGFIMAHFFTGN